MVYTQEKLDEISRLSGINFTIEEIAVIIKAEKEIFIYDSTYNLQVSEAIQRGKLQSEIESREKAKTSPQFQKVYNERNKEEEYKKLVNSFFDLETKKKDEKDNTLIRLDKYTKEEIQLYRKNGSSAKIDADDQRYIDYLDVVAESFGRSNGNVHATARKLQDRFPKDNINFNTAKRIVYDAITFFYLDTEIQAKAWSNYYAYEVLPKLSNLALLQGNVELSFKIEKERNEIIGKSIDNGIPAELLNCMRPIFINPNIDLKRLGLEKKDIREIYEQATDFIKKSDIPEAEKERLFNETANELDILDVEFDSIKEK
jgi:hypothetical protein